MSFKREAVQLSYDRHNFSELALDYRTIEEFWKQKNNFKNVAKLILGLICISTFQNDL
jgi:hypothetical protein